MVKIPPPECANVSHAQPSHPGRFLRFARGVLRTATIANALGGILSFAMNPYRTRPSWGDPASLSAQNVFMATGYASLVILAAWAGVYFGFRLRRDPWVRIGFVVSMVHAAAWLLVPRVS